ncbi:type VI secretion system accessory protein TagJ [Scandinavium manionii]|uniref:type VI secretion system accessory protein TagJ n=1 Tax=Scandinavium manionii TaxID=2926520 RepID=UPI002165E73F|nr:type VI secretion system accessory protein TagJ [Scandinavium manionii]MCS2164500.1 protein of avirulence locus ImpE [Scandinavium manionii]
MNTLSQLLAGESVFSALQRLENDIKAHPADADLRAAFVQFLCLSGNWSRALVQLQSWLALKPQARPTVTLLEQTLQGEQQRADVWAGRVLPHLPEGQWPWLATLASSLAASDKIAYQQRLKAFELAEENPGELTLSSGSVQPFAWLMDGDARLGPVCELIVNGRYFWLPFSALAAVRFQAPVSVTDLVWRHALVRLADGSEQVCQIPARYPLTPKTEERFMLGHATEWLSMGEEEGDLYQGVGQKVWLNDGEAFSLLSLDVVSFS